MIFVSAPQLVVAAETRPATPLDLLPVAMGRDTTVQQLADYWREIERHRYKEASYATRTRYVDLLCADFGNHRAEDIHVKDILRWFASKPSERHGTTSTKKVKLTWDSPGTLQNVARIIIHLFNLGEKHGLIDKHRLRALMENFEPGRKRRPITKEEYALIQEHSSDQPFKDFVEFLYESDSRVGEARSMTWPMVNWNDGYVLMPEHKTVRKTHKPRIIPLTNRAIELFCHREAVADDPVNGFVFLNAEKRQWQAGTLTKRMKALRRRAGLTDDVYLHGIRKFRLSMWAAKGMPIKVASAIAGHASITVTEEDYMFLAGYVAELREAMEKYR